MLRSLIAKIENLLLMAAVEVAASTETLSVDVQGKGSLVLLVNAGDFAFSGTDKISLVVEHSDDDAAFSPVGEGDLYEAEDAANGIAKILDDAADAEKLYAIHYLGNKRYVRLSLVAAGTVAAPIAVNAVAGHLEAMPA